MHQFRVLAWLLFLLWSCPGACQVSVSQWVNPLWGAGAGHVFPGACSPYGMVRLSPDVAAAEHPNGYIPGKSFVGFSHTHSSAGVEGVYGHLLVSPQMGKANFKNRSYLTATEEVARPGYYSVLLGVKGATIKAELTANQNVGRHRFHFEKQNTTAPFPVSVLLDPSWYLPKVAKTPFTSTKIAAEADGSFYGWASFARAPNPVVFYFSGQVNLKNPTVNFKIDTTKMAGKKPKLDTTGFWFGGEVSKGEPVELTVAFSYKNPEEAQQALNKALTQSFEDIAKKAAMAWEDRLSVIQAEGITNDEKQQLYSALYNTMLEPADVSGNHPQDQFGEAHFWDQYLGQAYNSVFPLHNLLYIPHQRRVFNSLLRIDEAKGFLPENWQAGNFLSSGYETNAEGILAEAVVKGLFLGLDAGKTWKIVSKNATQPSDSPALYGRSRFAIENGYWPGHIPDALEASLALSRNNFAIACMAEKMGKPAEEAMFKAQSLKILSLWNTEKKSLVPKDSTGKWMKAPMAYGWMLSAPHLVDTLRTLMGETLFTNRLDSLLAQIAGSKVEAKQFLLPAVNMASKAPENAENAIVILTKKVAQSGTAGGLHVDDNGGATSAWWLLYQLGLLPVSGTDAYWIVRPAYPQVQLTVSGGKVLTIKRGQGRLFWRGKELKGNKLKHSDLLAGGVLEWR